ncbi:MAG: bifunctional DNA primase/polymerase [Proteobacteria bacterium]|nr:bifunctional DNA primase/polymerase [Pseudomonadota bacterium]
MGKTTLDKTTLQSALNYLARGFSVIPIRPDKTPYIQWAEFQTRLPSTEEIKTWWQKWPDAMIGIVTGKLSDLCAIDCDSEEGETAIEELLPDSIDIPTARTPGGGKHLYFKMPDEPIGNNTGAIPGVDFRGEGGYIILPPSQNSNGEGYKWIEGLSIENIALSLLPEKYKSIVKELSFSLSMRIGDEVNDPDNYGKLRLTTDSYGKCYQQGQRDDTLFHIANCLTKGGCEEDLARKTLELLALQCDPPFDLKDVNVKIDSALKRSTRRERNISEEVRKWVITTVGYFLTTEVHGELRLTTAEHKKACYSTLLRMCEAGELKKHGDRRGCFRAVDKNIEFMDFGNADLNNFVPLQLPLDIHLKTKFFPKSVIALMGVSGFGKTTFALNTIGLNFDSMPCFYFNSEMSREALKKKLSYFLIPMDTWVRKMKVIDDWDFNNIEDKIQPDAFNVVDYLEPEAEKTFNIHGVISTIIKKLNKGMALICIQKRPGSKLGTGGIYSIKASSLALAMDWGKIQIVKNRFREEDKSPSSNTIDFNIEHGCNFVKTHDWYVEQIF